MKNAGTYYSTSYLKRHCQLWSTFLIINGEIIRNLRYADDIALGIQRLIDHLVTVGDQCSKKTQILIISKNNAFLNFGQ